jgi:hypothetical protein
MAARGEITFREAIGRLYDTKEAVALANPYAVAMVSYAVSFLYHLGVLCYIYANEIRVLNVHRAETVEQVLNVRQVLRRIIPTFRQDEVHGAAVQLSLLQYHTGVLAILAEIGPESTAWLIALDVTPHGSKQPKGHKPGRVRFRTQLQSTRRLFVRHDGSHLFYGSYSTMGTYDEPQWTIHCADLTQAHDARPVFLENFAGSDMGQSACFEMFQGHLYAVSNVVDSDEEELNWTSYYEWVCIPPGQHKTRPRPRLQRIWRREHKEGPINDTWTDMSLREDEATGQLMIFECRREWRNGGSENIRTYYTQPLPSPSEALSVANSQLGTSVMQPPPPPSPPSDAQPSQTSAGIPIITGGAGPSNVILSDDSPTRRTLSEMMTRNQRLPDERPSRYVHAEYREDDPSRRHDFILARTKFRAYNPSASAFLDLVNDPAPNARGGGGLPPPDRLRLRVCSRKRKSPLDDDRRLIKRKLCATTTGEDEAVCWSDERFESRGIKLWPSENNTPPEIADLLCPAKRTAGLHAVADERSIVYSIDADDDDDNEHQALVLISFDPRIRFPSMRRLSTSVTRENTMGAGAGHDPQRPVGIDLPRSSDAKGMLPKVLLGDSGGVGQSMPSVRTEPAIHTVIKRGFWLR